MKNLAADIHDAIAAVCPIDGVRVSEGSKDSWAFFPLAEATKAQKQAAQTVIDSFDLAAWLAAPEELPPDPVAELCNKLMQKGVLTQQEVDALKAE